MCLICSAALPSLNPLATPDLFAISVVLSFLEHHIDEVILCSLFRWFL